MSNANRTKNIGTAFCLVALAASAVSCTGQIPGSFRFKQQEEAFSSQLQINTKIDLLWVVDNSSSMDISQDKLRRGFASFAQKYMQPTWDIRVAVITTDTYLANPAFSVFLNKVMPGSEAPWQSPYLKNKLLPVLNTPSYDPVSDTFPAGIRYNEVVPAWGSSFSRLLPGLHDGPIAGLCFEGLPYFLNGVTQCEIRDDQNKVGSGSCIEPGAGEDAISECVNTVENNTVRSNKPIIATAAPDFVLADVGLTAQWREQLRKDFLVNVTTGSVGFGSERGFASVLQLLQDNEVSETAFFRKDAFRGIIFVADEDDQTMELPETVDAGFSPWTHYNCDQASLLAANPGFVAQISGAGGLCCSGGNCRYGAEGTTCQSKTVGGLTYTPSICPNPDRLLPISDVKTRLDNFFLALDEVSEVNNSYFVASIVPLSEAGIVEMQLNRDSDDAAVGSYIRTKAVDRGDRYIALGDAVANGSLAMDIAAEDYSPVLDQIGKAIIEKKSVFTLVRAPTGEEEMVVKVQHANGSSDQVSREKYVVDGKVLTITDQDLVLSFKSTDTVLINYQPRSLY